jgi:hypothetical protein
MKTGRKPRSREDVPQRTCVAEHFHWPDGSGGKHLVEKKDGDLFHPEPPGSKAALWLNSLPTMAYLSSCCKGISGLLLAIERNLFEKSPE